MGSLQISPIYVARILQEGETDGVKQVGLCNYETSKKEELHEPF